MVLSVERALEQAAAGNSLDDFGDPSFREGFERLVASVEGEACLNVFGEQTFDRSVQVILRNRLRVTDWVRRHPEVLDTPVRAPLIIVGLPRTGSTAVSHLLATDPRFRCLRGWESADSIPPPTTDGYWDDPRFVAAREAPYALEEINPEFRAIHYDPPEAAVECVLLLQQHFAGIGPEVRYNVPSFGAWLASTSQRPAYLWHRQVLQVLQSRCPGRWHLKTPNHPLALDVLEELYPDACFVLTHRDPAKVLPSTLSLVRSLSSSFSDVDHSAYIVRRWSDLIDTMLANITAFRDRIDPARVYDLRYERLVADPVGAVADVYEHFGIGLPANVEAGFRSHAGDNPQGKYGRHRYSPEEFGLAREDLDERFARYRAQFGVETER